MAADDSEDARTFEELHAQTLRHLGRRLFAEARRRSESDEAELETWKREHRGWWSSRFGVDLNGGVKVGGDPEEPGNDSDT
jgi:hypothetical protein